MRVDRRLGPTLVKEAGLSIKQVPFVVWIGAFALYCTVLLTLKVLSGVGHAEPSFPAPVQTPVDQSDRASAADKPNRNQVRELPPQDLPPPKDPKVVRERVRVEPSGVTPSPAPSPTPEQAPEQANAVLPEPWRTLAMCESGLDPRAVNPAGYYGLFQFSLSTWASVGGVGNPTDASVAEQLKRAQILQSRSGWSPWPVCGATL